MFLPIGDQNRTQRFPVVTGLLIFANFFVGMVWVILIVGEHDYAAEMLNFAFVPAAFSRGDGAATIVTCLFLHAGVMHFLGNMLFLWTFGHNVEDALGHLGFLVFYLVCGVAATLAFWWTQPGGTLPLLGASGAVAGVMGAYLIGFFREKITVLFFVLPLRFTALNLLFLWIVYQVVLGIAALGDDSPGVAYAAHVGGFAAGALMFKAMRVLGGARPYSEADRVAAERARHEAAQGVDIRRLRKARQSR